MAFSILPLRHAPPPPPPPPPRARRSLAACEQLSLAGYGPIAWISGGFDTAQPGDLPTKDGADIRLGGGCVGGWVGGPPGWGGRGWVPWCAMGAGEDEWVVVRHLAGLCV